MSAGIRTFHRWMAITFTLLVIANVIVNFVVKMSDQITQTVGVVTLIPLFLLMFTGLYMFFLPYVSKEHREWK